MAITKGIETMAPQRLERVRPGTRVSISFLSGQTECLHILDDPNPDPMMLGEPDEEGCFKVSQESPKAKALLHGDGKIGDKILAKQGNQSIEMTILSIRPVR